MADVEGHGQLRQPDATPSQGDSTASQAVTRTSRRFYSHAHRFFDSIGLVTVYNAPIDAKLILAQRYVRVFAYGLVALILATYLAALGISETQIGIFFGLTLIGDLFVVMLLTQLADTIGLKKILILGAVSMTASGLVFALSGNYWVLLTAAIVGVVSPSATEVGPFKTIEESALFTLMPPNKVVDIPSWYNTAEFASVAVGLLVGASILESLQHNDWNFVAACRVVFLCYAAVGILKIVLSSCLSSRIEPWHHSNKPKQASRGESDETSLTGNEQEPLLASSTAEAPPSALQQGYSIFSLDREERLVLFKLCILMPLDAAAVGLQSVPWQTYFVRTRFHVPSSRLGKIFFCSSCLGALGTILSIGLARKMGNMMTLAVTSYLTGITLLFFGLPNTINILLIVILLEAFLEPIYIAPRNALIGALLAPTKRTASLGFISIVKMISNGSGSALTDILADRSLFWLAFAIAGILKIGYATGMLWTFFAIDRKITAEQKITMDEECQ
ncbi:hypothetical protein LTR97_004247 [Elasticomyces elasticus]|uniref:Major facilitator superfamily (MFS) profile domain-containing protein n=1 Tax=Elasticomyces elasticus TaxID=574655 RepID=A0AAN7W914_9PEZI|nr:hypothetical protein LTR97_004247 [Elasticomyces elasticus]